MIKLLGVIQILALTDSTTWHWEQWIGTTINGALTQVSFNVILFLTSTLSNQGWQSRTLKLILGGWRPLLHHCCQDLASTTIHRCGYHPLHSLAIVADIFANIKYPWWIDKEVWQCVLPFQGIDEHVHEVCRYGGACLHSVAAFMGGSAAQEGVKILTGG